MEFDLVHGYVWLALGVLLGLIEMMVGTYFLLALAGGALFTGVLSLLFAMPWMVEVMLFAVFCVVSLGVLLRWKQTRTHGNQLTDDITRMHGERVTVVDDVNPVGRVRYKGVTWKATSTKIFNAGEAAIVERVDGSTLHIKKEGVTS